MAKILGLAAFVSVADGFRSRRSNEATFMGVKVNNFREDAQKWTVLFKDGASDADIQEACAGQCAFMGHPDKGGLAFATLHGQDKLEHMLSSNPSGLFKNLQPDEVDMAIPETAEGPDRDVRTRIQAQGELASWGLDRVGVKERPTTGKGVNVYVQDTGIRVSHNDFGGRATSLFDMTSGKQVMCASGDRKCARDGAGHGTHCAGTVGGEKYGVAPGVKLYGIKTLSDGGTGDRSWNVAGVDWITANGKRPAVISLSLGGEREGVDEPYNGAITAAVASGVVVVVAAGNFGSPSCKYSPAFVQASITVGATGDADNREQYSNFGPCNNIMAPGTRIVSASHEMDWFDTKKTGTSMACPHVSGAAALLLEANPSWGRAEVMAHFTEYGRKGFVEGLKGGDPDLFLWVGASKPPGPPKCPDFATEPLPNYWGDCKCQGELFCSVNGGSKNCPTSYGVGGWGGNHFDYKCSDCKCA